MDKKKALTRTTEFAIALGFVQQILYILSAVFAVSRLDLPPKRLLALLGPQITDTLILAKNEQRNEVWGSTHLKEDRVLTETVEVFLALPPIIENRDVELRVVGLTSIGIRLIADELDECIEATRGGCEGLISSTILARL